MPGCWLLISLLRAALRSSIGPPCSPNCLLRVTTNRALASKATGSAVGGRRGTYSVLLSRSVIACHERLSASASYLMP